MFAKQDNLIVSVYQKVTTAEPPSLSPLSLIVGSMVAAILRAAFVVVAGCRCCFVHS